MEQLLAALDAPIISLILLLLFTLLFLLFIMVTIQVGRLRKQLRRFMSGGSGESLESSLHRLLDENDQLKQVQSDQQFQLHRLTKKLASQSGNLALIRYNAFGDLGNDLSFSLALLDEQQNGIVITSIYGREESRVYAKPIAAGTSSYNLSEEEKAAIKQATNPKA
ncbi:DUF4446 family protein [Brevibacillus humidisoli]|uniref:DUF4446 family protein n=1 Tax=Brevibacillus humidisoli TaxID=2895522 RepID=UPI001E2A9C9D|nr:DUF4446 family protein [Brevibacillus humidisoli]UFJ41872.1 DUF4446 family protein [Brevibacillus humidisoli]